MCKPSTIGRAYELGYFAARDGLPPRPAQCHEISEMIRNANDGAEMRRIIHAYAHGHRVRTAEGERDGAEALRPRSAPKAATHRPWRLVGAASTFLANARAWLAGSKSPV